MRDETEPAQQIDTIPGLHVILEGAISAEDIPFLKQIYKQTHGRMKLSRWKKKRQKHTHTHNLEGKQAVPYGFQGLHLFFRVPLSGAERGKSSGENGEP